MSALELLIIVQAVLVGGGSVLLVAHEQVRQICKAEQVT